MNPKLQHKKSPCMGCIDRKLKCHASCPKYSAFTTDVKKERLYMIQVSKNYYQAAEQANYSTI